MDSLEVNKWIAAILVAGIAFMVTGFIGEILVHPRELAKPAIEIAGVPSAGAPAAQAQAPKAPPIAALLASADTAKGQQIAETNCGICHTFNQGGAPKIGPNLYGVVDGPRAHEQGFDYTEGLRKLGGTWTYENLNQWLWDPHSVVPGTRMAFAGLKNNKERADVIAWLRTLSPNPPPLPTAEEVKAAEAEKPAAAPAAGGEQEAAPPAAPSGPSFDALLAKADPEKGKADAETNCTICHSFGKGEPAKIGPNLYGTVGAPRAHMPGFDYSAGLKKLGGKWTYDELNPWLADPKAVVPDTKMLFPGIKSEKERADIVAYLRTLADHPEPLPAAEEVKAEAEAQKPAAAPAAGGEQEAAQPAAPSGPSFDALLAKADPEKGKADAETNCTICHSFGKGEPAKIGPNLYGTVGAPRAHMPGFDYSAGLKKLGGKWTYDELNPWLADPRAVVADTKMLFPGIKSEKERADIVAYLRTLADHPEPLPAAAGASPAPKPEEAQPAKPATEGEGASGQPAAPAAGGAAQEAPTEKPAPAATGAPAGNTAAPTQPQAPAPAQEGSGPPAAPAAAPEAPAEKAAPAAPAGSTAAPAQEQQQTPAPAPAHEGTSGQPAAPASGGATPAPAETAPAATAPAPGNAAPAQPDQVSPAREGTSGEQAAPATGGTSQETPAEKASPGGAGTPTGEPQGGAAGAPAPAPGKP